MFNSSERLEESPGSIHKISTHQGLIKIGKSVVLSIAEGYFTPRFWEPKLYEYLGVRTTKSIVLNNSLVRHILDSSRRAQYLDNYFLNSPVLENARGFEGKTRFNELCHLLSLTAIGLPLLYSIERANFVGIGIFTALGIVNVQLIMLQRYNRIRILKILERDKQLHEDTHF